ncbi:MAG: aspartyl protease family protein [Asticcacaulis sp.]|nr:aspartyl protease family protein [Asticcacaulis sp.]
MTHPFTAAWTRRRAFLGAGALAALPFASHGQQVTANATLETPPDQASAQLAAQTDAASHLTVAVRIKGRILHFVVDTAAERSVIADNVVQALGLMPGAAISLNGLAGRMNVATVVAETLEFGPFHRKNVLMPVLPRALLAADGYLGLDVIDGTCVTFDFRNSILRIDAPGTLDDSPAGVAARVRLTGAKGYLRVADCLVDSVPASAFIDTGAEVSVGNVPLLTALKRRNKYLVESGAMVLTGVTGGEIRADVIPVDRIGLQGIAFTHGSLAISDVPDFQTWRLLIHPALLIGMDYLRQFARISIDYRAKRVQFELSEAPPRPAPGVEITAAG